MSSSNGGPDPERGTSRELRARDLAVEGKEFGRLAGLGMQFALTILVLAFGGYWLDQRVGTLPLFLIVGVLLGFVGGTVSMVKKVSPPDKEPPQAS